MLVGFVGGFCATVVDEIFAGLSVAVAVAADVEEDFDCFPELLLLLSVTLAVGFFSCSLLLLDSLVLVFDLLVRLPLLLLLLLLLLMLL